MNAHDDALSAPGVVAGAPAPEGRSSEAICHWLVVRIAALLETPADDIDPDAPLMNFALSSVEAVSLSGELEEFLDVPLSPLVIYQHPTVASLARHLAGA